MTKYPIPLLIPFLLVFYEIATYFSNDMYLPAVPQMMSDLDLTASAAQWSLAIWFLGSASTPLGIGILADRYGRRPVLLVGGIIYILSTLVCALAPNAGILLAARFVQGGMVPAMLIPSYACIHESYEQKEAIKIIAFMNSISIIAPGLGPLFGGIILTFTDWRGIFWMIAILASVAILLLYRFMPETLTIEKRQPMAIKTLARNYWGILTNARFMLLMSILGLIFAGFIAWVTAGPLLVIEHFNYSAITFGVIQMLVFTACVLGNRLVKIGLAYQSTFYLINAGFVITMLASLIMIIVANLFSSSLMIFLIGMMIYSFGSGLCFPPLNRSVIEASDAAMGLRVAMFTVMLEFFAALGSGLTSFFFMGTTQSLAYLMGSLIIIAVFLFMVLQLKNDGERKINKVALE